MKKISLLIVAVCLMCGLNALADTYTITTAAEWNALVTDDDGYAGDTIYIANDIDFGSTSIQALGSSTAFAGEIDGNGKTITVTYASGTTKYGSLAITTDTTAYIHDLTLAGSYDLMGSYNGGAVGSLYGKMENVTMKGTVTATVGYCGGLVGYVYGSGVVTGCTFEGTITGSASYTAGLVACAYGTVTSCVNNGTVSSTSTYANGVVSYVYSGGTVTSCVNNGTVTSSSTQASGVVGYVANGGTVTSCVNNGTVTSSSNYASGAVAYVVNGGTVTDCGTSESGSVTGANYVGGAVGYVTGANSTISGCYNKGTVSGTGTYTGGVVGYALTKANITSCYNAGKVTASGTYVGGVVGQATYPILTDCYNSGTVESTSESAAYSAGIVGYMTTYTNSSTNLYALTMTNCYNTGTVTGYHVAGIFGFAAVNTTSSTYGTKFGLVNMTNCYNTSDITTTLGRANGLASTYTPGGTYVGCYNTGNITATSTTTATAGLFGANSGNQLNSITIYTTVSGCYNTGNVSSSASLCAGIMPSIVKYGTVDSCYNTGTVTLSGAGYVGGVLAYVSSASSTVSNCYNAGDVTQTGASYTGGIAGYSASTTYSNVFNCGNITGNGQTGGIFGCLGSSSLTNAYNTGTVSAGTYGGGIVGYSTDTSNSVSYLYNTGSITGTTSAGPITGGTVTSTISNAYYLSTTATGGSYDAAGTSVTYAELAKLDLGSSWTAGDDYTYPRIATIADNDYAKANAAAVIPADGDSYSSITTGFSVGAPDGVTWTASPAIVEFSGNTATFTESYTGTLTVTATAGDYTVSTELTCAVTVTTTTYDPVYWLSGSINSWSTANDSTYAFTNNGDGTHTLALDELYGEFKVITSAGGTWYGYGTIALDTEYTITTSGSNITLPSSTDTYTGVVLTLTVTDSAITLKVTAEGTKASDVDYYLTGDFNSWATSSDTYKFTAGDNGVYTLTASSTGFTTSVGFKIVTSTSVWLGYASGYNVDYDTEYTFSTSGNNTYLNTAPSGDYLYFTLTVSDGTYTFKVSQNDSGTSGISALGEDGRTVVGEKFYTAGGAQVAEPSGDSKAIYIVVKTYDDGTTETVKEVR